MYNFDYKGQNSIGVEGIKHFIKGDWKAMNSLVLGIYADIQMETASEMRELVFWPNKTGKTSLDSALVFLPLARLCGANQ